MSVRARVALAFAIFALPATALVLWGAWSARRQAGLEAVRATIVERMEEGGGRERCEADPARFTLGGGRRARRAGAGPLRFGRVQVYAADGSPSTPRTPPLDPEIAAALASGEPILELDGARGSALALAMPWSEGPCAVLVVAARGTPPLRQSLSRDLVTSAVVLGLALIVALVALGPPLARLRRLDRAVRAGGLSSFRIPPGVAGSDEIGSVAGALGEASARVREHVARLEDRDRALTSYVDATTHDLAIPLTVIQSRLSELDARVRAGESLEPGALDSLLHEHEYLGQLISNMAAAARFASGEPRVERHPVELCGLVERVASRHAALARAQGVALEHAVPSRDLVIEGDDILIERALSNLVHNAIRHGAARRASEGGDAQGHVAILLDARPGGGFRLAVADDGSGADVPRIERVLRGPEDEAEGDDRNARARGLGLRIVRAVIDAHGWTVDVARHEEGGLVVAITG